MYKGTVNDVERLLSADLIPLTAGAFVTSGSSTPLLDDGLLDINLIVHSHIWGIQFDTILVDYAHERKVPTLGPLFTWTLRLTSLAV
ncbi:hypothetical protein DFH94DRAFT_697490 [Russula ochroleuca]|uniref:Uncharacterized protein n=1 Tax=Russula ochroleuca TaxID=152965 RepID=A0A9P5JY27_9AGAM|nr:hypothetical protein DFH94DRAFT_697490 [Russula ochroleuca]